MKGIGCKTKIMLACLSAALILMPSGWSAGASSSVNQSPEPVCPQSQQNIVRNGDFEEPFAGGCCVSYFAGETFGGWTVEFGSVEHIGGAWRAARGLQSVDLNRCEAGVIYQDLSTTPGQTYLLRFAMAGNPENSPRVEMAVLWGPSSTPVDILSFNTAGHSPTNMGWVCRQYTVVATTNITRLRFRSLTTGCSGPALDDVSVTPIPLVFNLPLVSVGQASEGIRQTAFTLVNPTASTANVTLMLFQSDGTPLPVTIGGVTNSQFSFSIPAGGVRILETEDTRPLRGYAKVTTDVPIGAYVIIRSLSLREGRVIFETSYDTPTPTRSFTIVADSIGEDTDSGLVILNPMGNPRADLTLRLINRNGQQVGSSAMLSIGPGQLSTSADGEVIRFMSNLFSTVMGIDEFEGRIAISSSVDVLVLAVQKRGNRLTFVPVF